MNATTKLNPESTFINQATTLFNRSPDETEIGPNFKRATFHLASVNDRIRDVSKGDDTRTVGGRDTYDCILYPDGGWEMFRRDFAA